MFELVQCIEEFNNENDHNYYIPTREFLKYLNDKGYTIVPLVSLDEVR
jgi:hypothetical protein